MARGFAITLACPIFRLDVSRRGECAFTVTNLLGRPVRSLASVVPLGKTQAHWLRLRGIAERDLPPEAVHQLAIDVTLPPEAPEGEYGFQLLVADAANPTEVYTSGPVVTFQAAAPPARWHIPRWALLAVAAGLALALLLGIISSVRSRGEEPATGGSGSAATPAEPVRLVHGVLREVDDWVTP